MVGAMITHARLGETDALPINIGLLVLSIAVAAVRFIQL